MSPVHVPLENQAVHIYIHAYMHVHTRELSSFHCLDICVSVCRYVCVCFIIYSTCPTFAKSYPAVHTSIVNPRKLEHRFRMIHAGVPFTLL